MANEQVEELSSVQDAAMASSVQAIEELMEEVEKEIPLAVNQIFREADLDQDDYIREQEWMFAWQAHPEFVELLTIDGMEKMAQWASVVQEVTTDDDNDNDDKTKSSGQSLDTRLTYVDESVSDLLLPSEASSWHWVHEPGGTSRTVPCQYLRGRIPGDSAARR
ncbi:hypothetical protein GN244_ATG08699 [Phytophthora infestans]|uniref:Uncharacterized protein n=1 Tax=Phytophthora infestans TaxID=4787 RepID=A0A833SWE4_PHYIN|nr:hypothetical protein GN244_ATG08699 [Phytophthora infestans]